MKPARLLALLVAGAIFCFLLIFRTEFAHHLGLLTDADMGLRDQMILNHTSYEQACVSWRGAIHLLQDPPDSTTYSDFRGIVDPVRLNTDSLEKHITEAIIRETRAETERVRLRKTTDWNFFKSWLASTTDYTHSRRKCNRPDENDHPVKISLLF